MIINQENWTFIAKNTNRNFKIINTGSFTIKPDIKAETLVGAIGWAFGNQICIGKSHAFEPNQIKAEKKTKLAKVVLKCAPPQAQKKVVQVEIIKGIKLNKIKNIPIWVIIKYQAQFFKIPFLVASWTTKK